MRNFASFQRFYDSTAENEDSIKFHETSEGFRLAICDGAGGVGIFSKLWSLHLAKNQPEMPFQSHEEIMSWHFELSRIFYNEMNNQIPISNDLVIDKFENEGSFSTLLFLWYSSKDLKIKYLIIGNSGFVLLRKEKDFYSIKEIKPFDTFQSLNDFPKLVNWNKEININQVTIGENVIEKSDLVFCGTDAITKWLIMQFAKSNSNLQFDNLFNPETKYSSLIGNVNYIPYQFVLDLKMIFFQNNDKIKKYLFEKYLTVQLDPDDYTFFINEF